MESVAYLYDESWDGLLTAIFTAYDHKQIPEAILPEESAQMALGRQNILIESDPEKARRVEKGVLKKLGNPALGQMGVGFLSRELEKGTVIYRYVRAGLALGRKVYTALAHEDVLPMDQMCQRVQREAHHVKEFLRFSQMENGVYFSRITPENSVVPLLMPHFSDRFNDQPFLIYDKVHHIAGVYDTREWRLVETEELNLPELAEEEIAYRRLWKQFYNKVAVEERINPKLRRNMMPKKYWRNMTEFLPDNAK